MLGKYEIESHFLLLILLRHFGEELPPLHHESALAI
jgi:hypothetical protein